MLVTHGEVYVCFSVAGSIECALYQMLFHRCAWTLGILVEQQQSLWKLSVVQSLGLQHVGGNGLVFPLCHQSLDALALVLLAHSVQSLVEGKVLYLVKVLFLKVGCRHIIVGINKCKHVLEHTACSTAGRHKFHYSLALSLILVPCFYQLLALVGIRGNNTFSYACCSL